MDLNIIFTHLLDVAELTTVILWNKVNGALIQVPFARRNMYSDSYIQIDEFDTGIVRLDYFFGIEGHVANNKKRELVNNDEKKCKKIRVGV